MASQKDVQSMRDNKRKYHSVLYFHDIFYSLEATRENPVSFLAKPDSELLGVFDVEIRSVIESNAGPAKKVRVGSRLGGDGWGYVEFIAEGESYYVAPRVFVFEYPKYNAQSVVMKSYEEEKKTWYK